MKEAPEERKPLYAGAGVREGGRGRVAILSNMSGMLIISNPIKILGIES